MSIFRTARVDARRPFPPLNLADDELPPGWYRYRFRTYSHCALGPACPLPHPLYVGKSNEPLRRLMEHARKQWWFPLVSGFDVDPQVYATEDEVLAAERDAIRTELPLANVRHNERNRHRLHGPATVLRPARVARRQSGSSRPARRSWSAPRRAPRWVWRAGVVAAAWLVLAVAGWWAAAGPLSAHVAADGRPRFGAVAATVVVGWPLAVWVCRAVRRWWRGLWRGSRRR